MNREKRAERLTELLIRRVKFRWLLKKGRNGRGELLGLLKNVEKGITIHTNKLWRSE